VRYILDANLSPQVLRVLAAAGYDVTHVGGHGLLVATDDEIFDWAAANGAVVVTADSDFAMLLATRRAQTPSVVLLRDVADRPPAAHAQLLIDNLAAVEDVLTSGAIVSLSPTRLRVRELPIQDNPNPR
jgi:predicted nuclease of predicted toxin-antitoxin system